MSAVGMNHFDASKLSHCFQELLYASCKLAFPAEVTPNFIEKSDGGWYMYMIHGWAFEVEAIKGDL